MMLWDGGSAYVSMPVKVGATVLVIFSERDGSNFMEGDGSSSIVSSQLHALGLFPAGYIPLPTRAKGVPYSPTDILMVNDKSKVTITPSSIKMENASGSSELSADGSQTLKNSSGQMQLASSGEIKANGATITTDGNIITGDNINMRDFYNDYLGHRHKDVQAGSDTSGTKI